MKDPRGERRKHKSKTSLKCCVCGEQAKFRQFIKVNWFRGDDECVDVCNEHWKAPNGDFMKWLDSVRRVPLRD